MNLLFMLGLKGHASALPNFLFALSLEVCLSPLPLFCLSLPSLLDTPLDFSFRFPP